ncbi:MAG: histidinol-phosphate transaminase [Candidatus Omnitrophica bacterium]|nr:histidinol-phosphate transaminase [Candidatus Omnitrophota bacterium]
MKRIWKKSLDEINPYIPGKPIEEVKRELGLSDVVKLASNESPLPPSPKVIEAIKREAANVNRYPDGGGFYLKKAISGKLGLPAANIVLGNGSDEVLTTLLRTFIEPGDEIVIAKPTFLMYKISAAIEGAVVREVPMIDFKYDIDGMLKALGPRTKALIIANPDNPTGTYVNIGQLERIIEELSPDILLVLDEAYYEMARGGDYPESVDYFKKGMNNLVIARTFSKVYALAGLRAGYAIMDKDIAALYDKVRDPFNVNSIAQAAAIAALEDEAYMNKVLDIIRKGKERFYSFFENMGVEFINSRTNFVLVKIGADSSPFSKALLKKGVIVRDMSAWGLDGYIRVNAGTESENDKFCQAFEEALGERR